MHASAVLAVLGNGLCILGVIAISFSAIEGLAPGLSWQLLVGCALLIAGIGSLALSWRRRATEYYADDEFDPWERKERPPSD